MPGTSARRRRSRQGALSEGMHGDTVWPATSSGLVIFSVMISPAPGAEPRRQPAVRLRASPGADTKRSAVKDIPLVRVQIGKTQRGDLIRSCHAGRATLPAMVVSADAVVSPCNRHQKDLALALRIFARGTGRAGKTPIAGAVTRRPCLLVGRQAWNRTADGPGLLN